jgi:hypothetical protein
MLCPTLVQVEGRQQRGRRSCADVLHVPSPGKARAEIELKDVTVPLAFEHDIVRVGGEMIYRRHLART